MSHSWHKATLQWGSLGCGVSDTVYKLGTENKLVAVLDNRPRGALGPFPQSLDTIFYCIKLQGTPFLSDTIGTILVKVVLNSHPGFLSGCVETEAILW